MINDLLNMVRVAYDRLGNRLDYGAGTDIGSGYVRITFSREGLEADAFVLGQLSSMAQSLSDAYYEGFEGGPANG